MRILLAFAALAFAVGAGAAIISEHGQPPAVVGQR
jgi:hypothetical protein